MMIVTEIEDMGKSKYKIYIDDQFAFVLYQKDISHFALKQGAEITQGEYEMILEDTIFRRAKEKALNILKFSDRTEQELIRKLMDAEFPEQIIRQAVNYVIECGYLNDERFAATYIRAKKITKSKLVIKQELKQKGISTTIIDKVLSEEYEGNDEHEDAELSAIRKAIEKKTRTLEKLSPEDNKRLMASLFRKGFSISKIKQVLQQNSDAF